MLRFSEFTVKMNEKRVTWTAILLSIAFYLAVVWNNTSHR